MIFSEGNIIDVFKSVKERVDSEIQILTEDYILNVSPEEYANHLESKLAVDAPTIEFEKVYVDSYVGQVEGERFPFGFDVRRGKSYEREIIQYCIPVSGNINLLGYRPASLISLGSGGRFEIKGDCIVTEFVKFSNDPEKIVNEFDKEKAGIGRNYTTLLKDIERFNGSLRPYIIKTLGARRTEILMRSDFMASLGVPLKKKPTTPKTFTVPKPKFRRQITPQPQVNEKGFRPEPTLEQSHYQEILTLINDVGKNFERMESLQDKGEEDLRDHILMVLDPHFVMGSASGETFNKSGKTDILLKYDSSVLFVAECKFWTGEKGFLKTIDQLLGYLTWRDTKASVIVFVRQSSFTSILEKVKSCTPRHSNFLSYVENHDENWFNYRFHINGDENREVKLAVQLYHLPKSK